MPVLILRDRDTLIPRSRLLCLLCCSLLCLSRPHQHTEYFTYTFPFRLSLPHYSGGGEPHTLFSTVPPRVYLPNTHVLNESSASCGKRCHPLQCKDEGTEAQRCHSHAQGWTIPKQRQRQGLALGEQTSLCARDRVLCTPYQLLMAFLTSWHYSISCCRYGR